MNDGKYYSKSQHIDIKYQMQRTECIPSNFSPVKSIPEYNGFYNSQTTGRSKILEKVVLLCVGKEKPEIFILFWNHQFPPIGWLLVAVNCSCSANFFINPSKKFQFRYYW